MSETADTLDAQSDIISWEVNGERIDVDLMSVSALEWRDVRRQLGHVHGRRPMLPPG